MANDYLAIFPPRNFLRRWIWNGASPFEENAAETIEQAIERLKMFKIDEVIREKNGAFFLIKLYF